MNFLTSGKMNRMFVKNLVCVSALLALGACSKWREGIEVPPQKPGSNTPSDPNKIEYIRLKSDGVNQLQLKEIATNHYEIRTTGTDPYLRTQPITADRGKDSVVLTFQYQCSSDVDIEVFFAPPISQARAVKPGTMTATNQWKTYSANLIRELENFSWGRSGEYLRLDFGTVSGVWIQIKDIYFRGMTAEEKEAYEQQQEQLEKDARMDAELKAYLNEDYPNKVTRVVAGQSNITITGTYSGEGKFSLCEIPPYLDVTEITKFEYKIPLESPSFNVTQSRYVDREGYNYDRTLSKWAIVQELDGQDILVSHARYADQIEASQTLPPIETVGKKKGLGLAADRKDDIEALGIQSGILNIPLMEFMRSKPGANTAEHVYGGKTYYFYLPNLKVRDEAVKLAYEKGMPVAGIILIQLKCADPEITRMLVHPECKDGTYSMPNMTNPESVNCYAAALDFLAKRYSGPEYGRVHYWVMHNEVDAGAEWTNMGNKTVTVYMDTYLKSLRMCYNIARRHDNNAEVLASFTHSWASSSYGETKGYKVLEMINLLKNYSEAEGDFKWGLAYHSYPEDLTEPKTWEDTKAQFTMNTPMITFKNLEVLDKWSKMPENQYLQTTKRTIWLSENGTNSKSYSEQDLAEQAAGLAYAWTKVSRLDGIDVMIWHRHVDHRQEYGLRLGLRKYADDETDPNGAKPVWYLYQAAGTPQQEETFAPYKEMIGIKSWDDIMQTVN